MKKLFFAFLLLPAFAVTAQYNHQAPETVQRSFQREHPEAHNAHWIRSNNQWHASYRDNNNRNVEVRYDIHGNHQATHFEMDRRDVPRVIDERVRRDYHSGDHYTVRRIERPNLAPLFQLSIGTGRGSRVVYMDEQGRNRNY